MNAKPSLSQNRKSSTDKYITQTYIHTKKVRSEKEKLALEQ